MAQDEEKVKEALRNLARAMREMPREKRIEVIRRYLDYFVSRARENRFSAFIEFTAKLSSDGIVVWAYMWRPEFRDVMMRIGELHVKIFYAVLSSMASGK